MSGPADGSVKVWDLFLRLFHWALVTAFAVAFITGEDWRNIHLAAGYTAVALIAMRVMWGFTGGRYARFANFVKPRAIAPYLQDAIKGQAHRYLGHNPAGGAMIVAMLTVVMATSVSGILLTTEVFWGSDAMDEAHELLSNIAVGCIFIHVAGVIVTSWHHRENLIAAMITGRKRNARGGDIDV